MRGMRKRGRNEDDNQRQKGRHRDKKAYLLQRDRINRIIRTNHNREIRLPKVIIDLVHFKHNIVRNAGFGEEHVALAWHAAGDGVDGEADVGAVGAEEAREFGYWVSVIARVGYSGCLVCRLSPL